MKVGDTFKSWKIIEEVKYISKEGWNKTKFKIQCSCGYIRKIDPWDIKDMVTKKKSNHLGEKCRKCKEKLYWSEKDDMHLYKLIYVDYKHQAKKRGYSFELTLEEAYKLFTSNCHYCDSPPSNVKTHNVNKNISFNYQGIDRVDANGHYTSDNTLPCCSVCNYGKREIGYDEFYKWIEKVYNIGVQRLSRKGVEPSGSKQRPS